MNIRRKGDMMKIKYLFSRIEKQKRGIMIIDLNNPNCEYDQSNQAHFHKPVLSKQIYLQSYKYLHPRTI
jgi:hypothetical protein